MKTNFFLPAYLFTVLCMVTFISCSKNSSGYNTTSNPTPSGPSNQVSMYNMKFSPATLTVKLGTTVTWKNDDTYAHTATSNDGKTFDTGNIAGGASGSYTTVTAGTFDYHCTIHGSSMSGTLVVNP